MLQLAGGIIVGTTDTTWVIWRRPIFCATNLILIIHNQTSLLYSHGQDFISMAFLFVLQLWKKNAHRRKGAFSHASTAATVAQQLESYRQEWCTRILSTFVVVKVSCFQRLDSFSLELLLARSVKRHGRWQQLRWYGCGFFCDLLFGKASSVCSLHMCVRTWACSFSIGWAGMDQWGGQEACERRKPKPLLFVTFRREKTFSPDSTVPATEIARECSGRK